MHMHMHMHRNLISSPIASYFSTHHAPLSGDTFLKSFHRASSIRFSFSSNIRLRFFNWVRL